MAAAGPAGGKNIIGLTAGESSLSFVVADDHPMVRDALALALTGAFPGARISLAGSLSETQAALESLLVGLRHVRQRYQASGLYRH